MCVREKQQYQEKPKAVARCHDAPSKSRRIRLQPGFKQKEAINHEGKADMICCWNVPVSTDVLPASQIPILVLAFKAYPTSKWPYKLQDISVLNCRLYLKVHNKLIWNGLREQFALLMSVGNAMCVHTLARKTSLAKLFNNWISASPTKWSG